MTDRSRTYTWSDPSRNAEAGLAMAGIDFLRAMMDGSLPLPAFQATLDYVLIEVEEGRVVFEGRPAEYLLNPLGAVHGGYYAGMLDSALGCAIHSRLAAHQGYTPPWNSNSTWSAPCPSTAAPFGRSARGCIRAARSPHRRPAWRMRAANYTPMPPVPA